MTAPTVLVIDDAGLIPLRTGAEAAWFFEVVYTRYNKGPQPRHAATGDASPALERARGGKVRRTASGLQCFGGSVRLMKSSKRGTVNAVSPWAGL